MTDDYTFDSSASKLGREHEARLGRISPRMMARCQGMNWFRRQHRANPSMTIRELVALFNAGIDDGTVQRGWVLDLFQVMEERLEPEVRAALLECLEGHQFETIVIHMRGEFSAEEKEVIRRKGLDHIRQQEHRDRVAE